MTQPVKPADIYRLADAGVLPEKDVPRALAACMVQKVNAGRFFSCKTSQFHPCRTSWYSRHFVQRHRTSFLGPAFVNDGQLI